MKLKHKKQDLFKVNPNNVVFAHCIAKDLKYLIKMMKYASSVALDDNHDDESTSIFVRDEIDYKSDILKAIYISSVVTYGKCFSQAHGRKAGQGTAKPHP